MTQLDPGLAHEMLNAWGVRLAMSRPMRRLCTRARTLLFVALRPEQFARRREFAGSLKRPNWQHEKGSRS